MKMIFNKFSEQENKVNIQSTNKSSYKEKEKQTTINHCEFD